MIQSLSTDFITRLKNSSLAGNSQVVTPLSKFTKSIAEVLKKNGYISGFQVNDEARTMTLSLVEGKISGAKLFSKPGRRWYENALSLPWGQSKNSLIIVSTSSGVMTQREAKKKGIGGEIIAEIY